MSAVFKEHHCNRCGYDWNGRKPGIPVACPRCNNPNWHRPPKGAPAQPVADRTESFSETVSRLLKARTDICRTNTHCAIGVDTSGRWQALTPAQQQAWLKLPRHYGEIRFCLSRYVIVTADSLGRRLFGKQWRGVSA